MRACLLATARILLGLGAGLFLHQCYVPTYADCAFRCGTAMPMCPEQYECRSDGYCHLPDSMATCRAAGELGVTGDLGADDASSTGPD